MYVLDLTNGEVAQVTDGGVQIAFSPDGKYLYYPRQATVVRREIATGSESEIHRGPGADRALLMSPDGRWLATFRSGTIVLVPTEEGNVRELLKSAPGAGRFMNPMGWSRDGRHLFITVLQAGDIWKETIWRLGVDTGEVVDTGIWMSKGKINRISHGAGGELAVSVSRGEFEMWAESLSSLLGRAEGKAR